MRTAMDFLERIGVVRGPSAVEGAREAARRPDKLGFRSRLFEALADEPMNQGVPDAWRNRFRKFGVSDDEMRVSGVTDLFRETGKHGVVTREALLERARRVELEEVPGGDPRLREAFDEAEQLNNRLREIYGKDDLLEISGVDTYSLPRARRREADRIFQRLDELDMRTGGALTIGNEPDFREFTVPGGSNYREVALAVPEGVIGREFEGAHFGGPGVVAHMRTTDRVINGQRTLYIEEVQSDLFQQARKGGFSEGPTPTRSDLQPRFASLNADAVARFGAEAVDDVLSFQAYGVPPRTTTPARVRELARDPMMQDLLRLQEQIAGRAPNSIPRAPFEKSWPEMVLRRAMRIASEEGYDAVAIASPQAARIAQQHATIKDGIREFYGHRLPKAASKLGTELGLKTEGAAISDGVPVTLIRLTPEARSTITTQGFPMFGLVAAGGFGTLAALSGANDGAEAQEDTLTPDEEREVAMMRRLMELSGEAAPVAADAGEGSPADPGRSAAANGGRNLESVIRGDTGGGQGGEGEPSGGTNVLDFPTPPGHLPGRALIKNTPAIASDLGRFALELATPDPRRNQAVGTMRDTVENMLQFQGEVVNYTIDRVAEMTDQDAEALRADVISHGLRTDPGRNPIASAFGPAANYVSAVAAADAADVNILPEVAPPKTVTGSLARPIGTFILTFMATKRAIPALSGGKGLVSAGQNATAAAIADQVIAWEDGVANLVDELTSFEDDDGRGAEIAQSVIEFMSYDAETPETERRLKLALEGAGFGVLLDIVPSLLKGVRTARGARLAAAEADAAAEGAARADGAETAAEEAVPREAPRALPAPTPERDIIDTLGDPGGELLTRAARQVDEVGVTPADVETAASLRVPVGDEDVFVNVARIDTPDDIRAVISGMAQSMAPDVTAAARGVRTNEQIVLSAAHVDAWEVLSSRRAGQPLSAEESLAARQLWAASGEKLRELAQRAARGSSSDLFAFRRMLAVHHAIQTEVIAARTETARALQSWRIPAAAGEEAAKLIDEMIGETGGHDVSQDMARRIASLRDDQLRELEKLVETGWGLQTARAAEEWWVNGLLFNPTTHAVNAISNTAVMFYDIAERLTAETVARAIGRSDLIVAGEAMAQVHGLRAAIPDALRFAWKTLRSGESGFGMQKIEGARTQETAKLLTRMNTPALFANALGNVVTLPGRALGAADEFFKTLNYRAELHSEAFRIASRELADETIERGAFASRVAGLVQDAVDGTRETGEMRIKAREAAQRLTFTTPPESGDIITRGIMNMRGAVPVLGKVIFPFVNTPANLLRYSFQRTPLAPLVGEYRRAIQAGGRDALIANTRLAMGSMIMTGVADLVLNDIITGGGPGNRERREALERTGWQQYSIKIGDRYFAYSRVDPLGTIIGVAADFVELTANTDYSLEGAEEDDEIMSAIIASLAANTMSKTYLTGLADFFDVMSDPQRHADRWRIKNLAAFATPNFLPPARRFNDPYMRYTSNLLEEVRNRTPGLSESLPVAYDLWGRPREYQSGLGKVYDVVSPIYSRISDPEPIDEEIIRQGFTGIAMPQRSITIFGESVSLKNHMDVYSRVQERAGDIRLIKGATLLDAMNGIVTGEDPRFASLNATYERLSNGPDGGKEALLNRIKTAYYTAARQIVVQELMQEDHELVATARRRMIRRRAPAETTSDVTSQPGFTRQ